FSAVALAEGDNTFELIATDVAGNTLTQPFAFVRDSTAPAVTAGLQNDTGASNSDGLTQQAAIAGSASDNLALARLDAALVAAALFTDVSASLQTDGSFLLPAVQLEALAGGTLADGAHTVHLR